MIGHKFRYTYGGIEKVAKLLEINDSTVIFDNNDVISRESFDNLAEDLDFNENLEYSEADIERELLGESMGYDVHQPDFNIKTDRNGIPIMDFTENNLISHSEPVFDNPKTNITNPTFLILEKSKKVKTKLKFEFEIDLLTNLSYDVLNDTIENFEEDYLSYMVNNLDLLVLKSIIKENISQHYNSTSNI